MRNISETAQQVIFRLKATYCHPDVARSARTIYEEWHLFGRQWCCCRKIAGQLLLWRLLFESRRDHSWILYQELCQLMVLGDIRQVNREEKHSNFIPKTSKSFSFLTHFPSMKASAMNSSGDFNYEELGLFRQVYSSNRENEPKQLPSYGTPLHFPFRCLLSWLLR